MINIGIDFFVLTEKIFQTQGIVYLLRENYYQ